jgi:ankyrin repeat protein
VTRRDEAGRTPLHYAALTNSADQAQSCLASGDDPDAPDLQGFTPLHLAAQEGAIDVARLLLDAGGAVDQPNAFGNTPLFVAVFNSRGEGGLIRLLRDRGADPLIANTSGQTPVGLARLIGNHDVAQFFSDLA